MLKLYLWIRNWLEGEEGQDLAEYALILALIAVAAVLALTFLGTEVNALLNRVGDKLAESAT